MLFINDERVTISEIQSYQGVDEVMIRLKHGLQEINEYYNAGKNVVFKYRKGIIKTNKNGMKEGKKAVWIPYHEIMNTKNGTSDIVFCHSAPEVAGIRKFYPRGVFFRKKRTFGQEEKEEALFWRAVSGVTSANRIIIFENLEHEAQSVAEERMKFTELDYLIYSTDSPIGNDETFLRELAYAWAVPQANTLSGFILKERLRDAVVKGGGRNMGLTEFKEAAKRSTAWQQYKLYSIIQRKIDDGTLVYKNFEWLSVGTGGNVKTICVVPPSEDVRGREYLLRHLQANDEDALLVLGEKFDEQAKEKIVKQTEVLKPLKQKFDLATMTDEDIGNLKIQMIRKVCMQYKIRSFGLDAPTLKGMLKEKRDQLKAGVVQPVTA